MPALGAFNAFDAQHYPFGTYEHVMEPTADFGAAGVTGAPVAISYPVDGEYGNYQHPMEPTADFGADFTALIFGPW